MLTVMPVNATVARSDAPVVQAVPTGSAAVETRTSVTDVQHALQVFRPRREKKKKGDDSLRRMIRNILNELDGLTDELDEEEDQLLWYPPTAFEISQYFVRARRKYLETYLTYARKPLHMVKKFDNFTSLNEDLKILASVGFGARDLRAKVAEDLGKLLRANDTNLKFIKGATVRADSERKKILRGLGEFSSGQLSASQEQELYELTGLPPGEFDPDTVTGGTLGGLNESLAMLGQLTELYTTFLTDIDNVLSTAFGQSVITEGKLDRLPDGQVMATEPIKFAEVQTVLHYLNRRSEAIGREFALLRRGFAMELYLRGAQSMPHRVRRYSSADRLLDPRRSDDVIEKFL